MVVVSKRSAALLQVATFAGFLIAVVLNGLSARNVFGGKTNGDISNMRKTAFTPAGYAFSIWGFIYALAAGFAVWQALPAQAGYVASRIGPYMALNLVCNGLWSVVFCLRLGNLYVSAVLIFVGILLPLVRVYVRVGVGAGCGMTGPHSHAATGHTARRVTLAEYVWVHVMLSVYTGWTSVACIANTAIMLTRDNEARTSFLGAPAAVWCVGMMCVAFGLGLLALALRGDAWFCGPIAWALVAINKQQSKQGWPGHGTAVPGVALGLGVALWALIAATAAWRTWLLVKRRSGFAPAGTVAGSGSEDDQGLASKVSGQYSDSAASAGDSAVL